MLEKFCCPTRQAILISFPNPRLRTTTELTHYKALQGSPPRSSRANVHMQVAAAYNRGYLAFSDMKVGLANPAVYDLPSGNLDPYSMRPVGARWQANTAYQVGEVVTPATGGTVGNGHTYRCTVAGISGSSSPSFPTSEGGTVTDGGVTWTET